MIYTFDNDAVILGKKGDEYEIYLNGKKKDRSLSKEQLANPILAINEFISEISGHLRGKVRSYLAERGDNTFMGCTRSGIACIDCRARGLNTEGTRCPYIGE